MSLINWQGKSVPFIPGETVASALLRVGVLKFGSVTTGQPTSVFCGIGQCQGCLIRAGGQIREACLLQCHEGMHVYELNGGRDA